ncbi:MAG: DUF4270 domain-containing protein [Muribaculaceae bacterium]|nr:DUF4270 domain-containing protein [Muribaculaceae bacterium]
MLKAGKIIGFGAAVAVAASAVCSCDDSSNIGGSLVQDESAVVIADEFEVTGRTVVNPRVQSRSVTQVLGRLKADGYGNFSSDFVTQFMPSMSIDVENMTVNNIDSMKLMMFVSVGSLVGDSIAPMGLEVYRLNKQLKAPMYSNDDPSGYYDPADKLGERIYVCNALGATDSVKALSYRMIDVKLPDQLARDFINLYVTNPEVYAYPSLFANHFPGIYVKNTYGSGRVVSITNTMIRMYYHTTSTDSEGKETVTRYYGNYFAVTPEVVLNNNISYTIDSDLQARIDDGENIIIAPVGRDVEMVFPVDAIIQYYKENAGSLSVVNTLSLDIPAEAIENEFGIEPPENLLMVLSDKREDFFKNGELTDDVTSFYATYDAENNRYRFSGLRSYLLEMLKKEDLTPADYTFSLTPVSVETETSSSGYYGSTTYVSAINPYIGAPSMVKLDFDNALVTFSFSKQTVK